MMEQQLVLSAVQSRILLSLLTEGPLGSGSLLRVVGISGSSWAKEKRFLVSSGLLECKVSREITQKGIVRKMEFMLTRRGRQVSQNLLVISSAIDEHSGLDRFERIYPTVV